MQRPANFRDLGGLINENGKKIKPHRILRSGDFSGLNQQEKDQMLNVFELKKLLDLRTKQEFNKIKDDQLEGVEYFHIDIMENTGAKAATAENFAKLKSEEEVKEFMRQSYLAMISEQSSKQGYARLLKIIKDNEQGSVLFHCFAGKDRTGIAAAMVLDLLGVDQNYIFNDYMLSNTLRIEDNKRMMILFKQYGMSDTQLSIMQEALLVHPEYLEAIFDYSKKNFGSFTNYIMSQLDISEKDVILFRENYLE